MHFLSNYFTNNMNLSYNVIMYIRTISRKNKDGSETAYVQLAHNTRDPKSGQPRAKVIHSFGRADQLDRDALKRLAMSITRHLAPEEALDAQMRISAEQSSDAGAWEGLRGIAFLRSKRFGGAWLLEGLWKQLGMDQILRSLLKSRAYETDMERFLFAMVANRALGATSKLGLEGWVAECVHIESLEEVKSHQLYRAMDFLLEVKKELELQVYHAVADLLNLEVDLLYFDTTSSYFEVEASEAPEDENLRKAGYSKDKRPDLAQVVIGLAVTKEGIPIRSWTWPGNTADVTVVEEVKRDLVGWKLGRVISVMDRGFSSEENLITLQRAGGHYIVGEKMRSGKAETEDALSRGGRFHEIKENLRVKEIIVGEGERRKRFLLAFNPKEAEKQKKERDAIIAALTEELARFRQLSGEPHTKAMCALRSHGMFGKFLIQSKDGTLRLDKAAIRQAERYDGKYLIRTSDDTLSAQDAVLGYKQLADVEDAFRTLKTHLDLRPMYHRAEDRIRSHVLLCWLALLLARISETHANESWKSIREEMDRMHIGYFRTADGTFCQTTAITSGQQAILKALGIPNPPLISAVQPL